MLDPIRISCRPLVWLPVKVLLSVVMLCSCGCSFGKSACVSPALLSSASLVSLLLVTGHSGRGDSIIHLIPAEFLLHPTFFPFPILTFFQFFYFVWFSSTKAKDREIEMETQIRAKPQLPGSVSQLKRNCFDPWSKKLVSFELTVPTQIGIEFCCKYVVCLRL